MLSFVQESGDAWNICGEWQDDIGDGFLSFEINTLC